MNNLDTDKAFSGSVPALYESHLVPLIFEPYAVDLTRRVALLPATNLLEIAAGTGAVTRHLAAELPDTVRIVATDLNQAMLDQAVAIGTQREVQWQVADAMTLPFDDASFDVVVCQFGVMFFPDKPNAFAEARRVLKPGGTFIFNVWDRIEENDFSRVVTTALASAFPEDPPRFLERTPYGYHSLSTIQRDLRDGGFKKPSRVETVGARSRADSARGPAIGLCQGTPLRNDIEARKTLSLDDATAIAEQAIRQQFGDGEVEGKIQAHVIAVEA